MPVWDDCQHVGHQELCSFDSAALLTTGTEPAGLATERQQVFQLALGTADAGEAAMQITAPGEFFEDFAHHWPQWTIPGVVVPVIIREKRSAMVTDTPPERRPARLARLIKLE